MHSEIHKTVCSGMIRAALVALLVLGISACATSVSRVDEDETIDLSGKWNDSDSRLVAEEMISDSLSRPWLSDWNSANRNKPQVIVGRVRNLSMEHLNTNTFVKDLERELVNSGQVGFVATQSQREELRAEREDQASNASFDTMKSMGKELGADFMLLGEVDQINDTEGGKEVRFYQVSLEMIDLESNTKVWIGQKKIKKLVKKSGLRR